MLELVYTKEDDVADSSRSYPEYRKLIILFGCGFVLFIACLIIAITVQLISGNRAILLISSAGATIGASIITLTTMRRQNIEGSIKE